MDIIIIGYFFLDSCARFIFHVPCTAVVCLVSAVLVCQYLANPSFLLWALTGKRDPFVRRRSISVDFLSICSGVLN